jgi:hypothetical protein
MSFDIFGTIFALQVLYINQERVWVESREQRIVAAPAS